MPTALRWRLVAGYSLWQFGLSIAVGFVTDVLKRIAGITPNVWGPLDFQLPLQVLLITAVCMYIYRKIATNVPNNYWSIALPVAALTAITNLLSRVILAPADAGALPPLVFPISFLFHLGLALLGNWIFIPKRR
jgi:hypothetical protein